MCKPAGFPKTDGAEQEAVTTLLSRLNVEKVKPDIKTRDKYPNVDGTLEIVDAELRPEGKFDVQVKKVGPGARRYSCPIELYAYSKVSSLPVLLIVADTQNQRVMWRHIFGGMPEFKAGQNSFTVKFTSDDEIGLNESYIDRWRSIARDYSERIEKYPELSARVSRDIELQGINDGDVEYFQRYTNELNSFLERDFQAIRSRVLPPAARFGIGIANTSGDRVEYQHHRIEFGTRQPSVFRVDAKSMNSVFEDPKVLQFNWSIRSALKAPRAQALQFLKRPIEKALKERQLVIHGVDVACNVLAHFVERFPNVLGLSPAECYSLEDLQDAYYKNLPESCSRYLPLPQDDGNRYIGRIHLWQMEMALQRIPKNGSTMTFPLSNYHVDSGDLPLQAYEDSLKLLLANGIEEVRNPWDYSGARDGNYIWSYTDRTKVMAELRKLFQRLVSNYGEFARGNELSLTKSSYLDPNQTVVFNLVDRGGTGIDSCPIVEEFHVPNQSFELPKVLTFVEGDDGRLLYDRSTPLELVLDGKKHFPNQIGWTVADWPFRTCPYLHGVYRLLTSDLNAQYGFGFHNI